jgi:hypothetical protein
MKEVLRRDPDWTRDEDLIGYRLLITDAQAQEIIDANVDEPNEHNGRSGWYLVRTADGSLMLACYPHGDTYIETERYRGDL